jgi:hypothetical protein
MEHTLPKLNLTESSSQIPTSRATFRRKGQTYVIKNTGSNDDVLDVFNHIDEMYEDTVYKSKMADWKATIYKFIDVLFSIYICVSSSIIGSLSASNYNNVGQSNSTFIAAENAQAFLYAITILGYSVLLVKSIDSLFNFKQRCTSMKNISIQLRRIARAIKTLKTITVPVEQYYKKLDEYGILIDELEINMFGELNYPAEKIKQMDDAIQKEGQDEVVDDKDNKTNDTKDNNDVVVNI